MLKMGLCTILVAIGWAATAIAGESEIRVLRIDAVPQFIVELAKSKMTGVDWLIAFQDSEGAYRLVGNKGEKGDVARAEFICNSAGKDQMMFIPITLNKVPDTVRAAISREMPKFQIEDVHICTLDGKKVHSYRFQGEGYSGGSTGFFGVFVTSNGTKVTPMN